MLKQSRPLPPNFELAPTLARRLLQLREFRNMTVLDLAKLSRLGTDRIDDIEQGLETWLSTTDRQVLARALVVDPRLLQEVEKRAVIETDYRNEESILLSQKQLIEAILNGARDLECPNCGGTLKCSIQDALDIEGQPIAFPKAFCVKCPFILR
jgi:transcriptional regulator with XRE-family HTH domain